jgi:hypothetical protein
MKKDIIMEKNKGARPHILLLGFSADLYRLVSYRKLSENTIRTLY